MLGLTLHQWLQCWHELDHSNISLEHNISLSWLASAHLSEATYSTTDMIFVKSFTQARFQQIWKFTPITRKPRHVLPPKTPYKSKQMCDSPTVLLRYALSLLYNIKLIKNYTKIFKITQDMSSPAEILPNIEIIYTSAACDACDKYHVWL